MAILTLSNLSVSSAALILITAFAAYALSKTIYRLFFHPLARFPGPKLAAATFFYEIYFDVCVPPYGQFMFELDRLHEKYGPVVRCNPDEVHVSDPTFFGKIYTGPGHVRDRWARSIRANGSPGSVVSALGHEHHRSRRSALGPFFSKRTVQELEGSIRSKTEKLCEKLSASGRKGEIVEMGTAFTAVTLDVISEYCYGKSQNCLEEEDYGRRWKLLMQGIFDSVPIAKHFPLVGQLLQSLPRPVMAALNPAFTPFFEFKDLVDVQAKEIFRQEQARKGEGKSAGDGKKSQTVFHGILDSSLPDDEKTLGRVTDEAYVLVTAGGETTARVLAVTFSYLLQDPVLFSKFRKALDEVVGPNELPPSHRLEEIAIVKAVIQEGLRLAAPVTNRPILIAPDEDLSCGEWVIPRGTSTSMSYKTVLFDAEIFPDPHKFAPERWIQASERGQRLEQYLVTLSKGSRSCVGENVAYAELYLILAAVVTRFDMELVDFDRERDLKIVRDMFVGMPTKESRGLRVRISPRA